MAHGATLSNPWTKQGPSLYKKGAPLSRSRSLLAHPVTTQAKAQSKKGSSLVGDAALLILSLGGFSYAILAFVLFTWLSSTQIFVPDDQPVVAMEMSAPKTFAAAALTRSSNSNAMIRKRETAAQVQFVTSVIANSSKQTHSEALKLARTIVAESLTQNLDPFFVAAIIKRESTFKRHAVSHKGATGLMQLMPSTGEYISQRASFNWSGAHKLTEPGYNIRLGIAYIKELHRSFKGNTEHALIAYNWGPANLNRALRHGTRIPESTVRYARSVIKDHSKWRADYTDRANQFLYMGALGNIG